MTARSPNSVPGIYKIINKITGQTYVGGTNNCNKRWTRHKWALNLNFHKIQSLQKDWNEYGSKNFEFIIVLHLPKLSTDEFKILKTREETRILSETPNNYNMTIGAGDYGYKASEKTKSALSKINSERWKNPEYKKRLSKIHEEKWANGEYKKKATAETRKKQSEAKKAFYAKIGGMPQETKDKMSRAHQLRRKKKS